MALIPREPGRLGLEREKPGPQRQAELAWSVPQVRVAQGVGGARVGVWLGTPPSGQRALGPHPVLREMLGTWG